MSIQSSDCMEWSISGDRSWKENHLCKGRNSSFTVCVKKLSLKCGNVLVVVKMCAA